MANGGRGRAPEPPSRKPKAADMSLPPLHVPQIPQGADRLVHGLPDRGQGGHDIFADYTIQGHRVCECRCGASVELYPGVRPFCPVAEIEAEYASTLEAASAAINLAGQVRARKLQWAAREQ